MKRKFKSAKPLLPPARENRRLSLGPGQADDANAKRGPFKLAEHDLLAFFPAKVSQWWIGREKGNRHLAAAPAGFTGPIC